MAAFEYVSPQQFGFIHTEAEPAENSFHRFVTERKSKRLDLSLPLHSRQAEMNPSTVDNYARKGWAQANRMQGPPAVVKENNELVVRNGHHRIAAARQLGRKYMNVNYLDLDE